MATKNPLKYEFGVHEPFSPTDTVPAGQVPMGELDACALLSPDPTNQMSCRDGDLYYGTAAPPDLANLYVSPSLGNDANAGTRDAPLASVNEAFTRHENQAVTYNLHLRSGENHVLSGTSAARMTLANLNIFTYDEPTYQDQPDMGACIFYDPWLGAEYQRATLICDPYVAGVAPGGGSIYRLSTLVYNSIFSRGVNFVQRNINGVPLAPIPRAMRTNIFELHGGRVDVGTDGSLQAMISATTSFLQRVEIVGSRFMFATDDVRPRITWNDGTAARTDGCGIYAPFTLAPDNVTTVPLPLLVANPVNNNPALATYEQFNYKTSWDPRV